MWIADKWNDFELIALTGKNWSAGDSIIWYVRILRLSG